jgi:hypothetical protein
MLNEKMLNDEFGGRSGGVRQFSSCSLFQRTQLRFASRVPSMLGKNKNCLVIQIVNHQANTKQIDK